MSKSQELMNLNQMIAQFQKLQDDKKDIKNMNQQMNMISAFFNPQVQHTNDNLNLDHSFQQLGQQQQSQQQQSQQTQMLQKEMQGQMHQKEQVKSTAKYFNYTQSADSNSTNSSTSQQYVGPRGQSCVSTQDCEDKNSAYYKLIKSKLLGEDAANGEQGPQGQKGIQGLKGLEGPRGKNGQAPSHEYMLALSEQMAQDEIYKAAQGGVVPLESINNEYVLQKIYYFGEQNCKDTRNNYILKCQADLYTQCNNPTQPEQCCPSLDCLGAIDNLMCCFNSIKLPLDQVEQFDQEIDQVWLPLLKQIDGYENQYIQQGRRQGTSILSEFKDRTQTCTNMGFNTANQQCPIIDGNHVNQNFQQGSIQNV